ncbi:MAG: glycosyltransferase [Verrucomicrobiales bacterium]
MKREPLVSVMLPARDAADTLQSAAESCLQQTWADLEILLIANDSTPGTLAVMNDLAGADRRVRILHSPPRAGFITALNLGWYQARGRFLARMDADDFSYPDRIARQVQCLNDNAELVACGSHVRIIRRGRDGEHLPPLQGFADYEKWLNSLTTPQSIAAQRFIDSPLSNPSAMIRKEAMEQLGGYRVVDWAEDYDFWLRMIEAGLQVGIVPEVLLDWFDSELRMTRNDNHYSQRRFLQAKAHFLGRLAVVRDLGVGICGAGPIGKRLARLLKKQGVRIAAFYDVNDRRIGNVILGRPVLGATAMPPSGQQVLIGAVGVSGARDLIRERVAPLGYEEGQDFFCVA